MGIRTKIRILLAAALLGIAVPAAHAQKYRPDDPIRRDPDDLDIPRPSRFEVSPTFDLINHSWGNPAGPGGKAENINTIGEVPDSSWFTNRIGHRPMTAAEIVRGGLSAAGPSPGTLVIEEVLLLTPGVAVAVRDREDRRYLLRFDAVGLPSLATGAEIIASKLLWAAGYNVLPSTITTVLPETLEIAPAAVVRQRLGEAVQPLDEPFITELFRDFHANVDGTYRAVASELPAGEWVGQFRYYGTRPDDPNDIFAHENRRELRGLRTFAAWLNHTYSGAVNSVDYYVSEGGRSFLRHYLFDFTGALGSGYDITDEPAFKQLRSGYDYDVHGDVADTLKTAISLGLWERPWMRIDYPVEALPEVGRIEADYFRPGEWKPEYPNPAFDRIADDDALWAADILSHFEDDMIRAVVSAADYLDPAAAEYMTSVLIRRRDKLVDHSLSGINPIAHFELAGSDIVFRNPGVERALSAPVVYQYQWFRFDNRTEILTPITARRYGAAERIAVPADPAPFLAVRIRTRTRQQPLWISRVQVTLRRSGAGSEIVGVERETGAVSDDDGVIVRRRVEGNFEALSPAQQDLVLDWVRRFERVSGGQLQPEQLYDSLPVSIRTTFESVLHALGRTELTDAEGRPAGSALDLVEGLETVVGEAAPEPGDEPFKVFLSLSSEALARLEASPEFVRRPDNLVRHPGYPTHFRQRGGPPVVRFSLSADGRRSVVDIDYHQASFPQDWIDGRVASFDSDVRAGRHHERHLSRWAGLSLWWERFFGVPLGRAGDRTADTASEIQSLPRRADEGLEEATADFLRSWLVGQQPAEAASYFSPQSYSCLAEFADGSPVDFSLAQLLLLDRMRQTLDALPDADRLRDMSTGVRLTDPAYRLIDHARHREFVLFEIPTAEGRRLDCMQMGQVAAPETASDPEYGRFFAMVFLLNSDGGGSRVLLVWERQGGRWRIVSFQTQTVGPLALPPDLRGAPARPADAAETEPTLVDANRRFLEAWSDGQLAVAASLFEDRAADCLALYPLLQPLDDDLDGRGRLQEGLRRAVSSLGERSLLEVFEAPLLVHPETRRIPHPNEDRFTLATLSERVGGAALCSVDGRPTARPQEPGSWAVTAIFLKTRAVRAAPLLLIWRRDGTGAWRIAAFHLES